MISGSRSLKCGVGSNIPPVEVCRYDKYVASKGKDKPRLDSYSTVTKQREAYAPKGATFKSTAEKDHISNVVGVAYKQYDPRSISKGRYRLWMNDREASYIQEPDSDSDDEAEVPRGTGEDSCDESNSSSIQLSSIPNSPRDSDSNADNDDNRRSVSKRIGAKSARKTRHIGASRSKTNRVTRATPNAVTETYTSAEEIRRDEATCSQTEAVSIATTSHYTMAAAAVTKATYSAQCYTKAAAVEIETVSIAPGFQHSHHAEAAAAETKAGSTWQNAQVTNPRSDTLDDVARVVATILPLERYA